MKHNLSLRKSKQEKKEERYNNEWMLTDQVLNIYWIGKKKRLNNVKKCVILAITMTEETTVQGRLFNNKNILNNIDTTINDLQN